MSLLNSASLVVTPNGYKEGTLYSVIPNTTLGDMTVVRATTATRVNSAGLIELVPYNFLQYSEQFNNAAWGILNSASVSANTTNAPNGTLTADTLTFSANSSSSIYQAISSPAGETTLSIYAKTASGTKQFRLRIDSPGGNTSSDFTATTQWQRFDFSLTTGAAGVNFYIINDNAGTAGSIFIWGAQLEAGSYPTSYIPTTSAAVTRNADQVYKTGISALIGQTEGTALLDFQFNGEAESIIIDIAAIGFSPQNRIILYQPNTTIVQFIVLNNSVTQVNIASSAYSVGQRLKVGIAYKTNDFAFYINGVQIGTDNSGTVPATARIDIGNRQDAAYPAAISVNQATLFPTRLTNAELASLTT